MKIQDLTVHVFPKEAIRVAKGHLLKNRYRKVTTWARVQVSMGEKVVALVPVVTSSSMAHFTG